jgi:hypothetical protein
MYNISEYFSKMGWISRWTFRLPRIKEDIKWIYSDICNGNRP